jgi:Arc/MetJ family transcription regulator
MHIKSEAIAVRTTLDLPEDLLREAMQITHTGTKTAVIVLALEELVRKARIADIKKYRGKIALDMDMDVLRGR